MECPSRADGQAFNVTKRGSDRTRGQLDTRHIGRRWLSHGEGIGAVLAKGTPRRFFFCCVFRDPSIRDGDQARQAASSHGVGS